MFRVNNHPYISVFSVWVSWSPAVRWVVGSPFEGINCDFEEKMTPFHHTDILHSKHKVFSCIYSSIIKLQHSKKEMCGKRKNSESWRLQTGVPSDVLKKNQPKLSSNHHWFFKIMNFFFYNVLVLSLSVSYQELFIFFAYFQFWWLWHQLQSRCLKKNLPHVVTLAIPDLINLK